ncbi:sphingomyelin phosphodiesterase-like [Tropilaelaps mercedesae]|uniref:Sphingomyelin phosphodiesterase-like n=1 Tax=Tropilaelaps mercedesae TaxID=418985 RepID=A0A1V9Y1G5_9ACAR|nr:sphingomyelin phosphodiesterase-like [Tropilaelaps mercedesae]
MFETRMTDSDLVARNTLEASITAQIGTYSEGVRKGFTIALLTFVVLAIVLGGLLYLGIVLGEKGGIRPSELRRLCGDANLDYFNDILTKKATKETLCFECEAAMRTFRHHGFNYMYNQLRKMCLLEMSLYNSDTCLDILNMYKEEVRYIMYDLKVPDPEACKFVMGCGLYNSTQYSWNLNISTGLYKKNVQVVQTVMPFSVLHLTDTHISNEYTVGASYICKEELCCSNRQIKATTKMIQGGAGPYGDIRSAQLYAKCDLPIRTLKSLLKNAIKTQFSLVYLTGDFIPHTSFNYTFDRVVAEITEQSNLIANAIPEKPIYVSIGNHDDYPAFLFPVQKIQAGRYSVDKIYNALWNIWSKLGWIPKDGKDTFLRGGYYTAKVHPGIRLFSLNTIYCYTLNWWLAVDSRDPEDQLVWLMNGLEQAANAGERVHIIGHIPPGTTECYKEWAQAYQRIISRFANIIEAQFFGHMHWDQFTVDWSVEKDETTESVPTGVQIASPSATTYMTGYPSYRILHFGDHGQLLDMDTYLLNITKLNQKFFKAAKGLNRTEIEKRLKELDLRDGSHNEWKFMYSTRKAYGLPDLSPKSFASLIGQFSKENKLLQFYYRALFQFHDETDGVHCENGSCMTSYYYGPDLLHHVICEMHSYGSKEYTKCTNKYGIVSASTCTLAVKFCILFASLGAIVSSNALS